MQTETPSKLAPAWDAARHYHTASITHGRLTVAAMILTGKALATIKKELGYLGSGRRKESRHGGDFKPWAEYLAAEIPDLSDRTADRRIQLFDTAKRRLKALGDAKAVALLESGATSAEEQEQLEKLVQKLTNGHTLTSFFQEAGIAKLPQGAAAKGGNLGGEGGGADVEATVQQLAFSFLREPVAALCDFRAQPDYRAYLTALPKRGDGGGETPLGLDDLEDLCRQTLADIRDIKKGGTQ